MAGGTVIGRKVRLCALALAMLLGAVGLALASPSARAGVSQFNLVDVGDFAQPVHVDNAPGEPELLFVVEKEGTVRVLNDGVERERSFLNITDRVSPNGEEGLLSIAFHPNYDENRRFYVFYVNKAVGHDIQVDQFRRREGSRFRADPGSRKTVITVQHNQADNHNGGQLQFGPDGHLYISVGDGGPSGDPENDAQRPGSLLGKILRISPRSKGGYSIPPSNPYADGEGADEVYALGLRNPFRFSFDSVGGALTIGDVGGSAWEEVDYVAAPQPGLNFGWNDFEGTHETPFGIGADASPHTPPIHEYPNPAGEPSAVTGGYVVRDPGLPLLEGQYLYADFFEGALRTLQVPSGAAGTSVNRTVPNLSSFGEGTGGQIYVVSLNGDVFRLEQNG